MKNDKGKRKNFCANQCELDINAIHLINAIN